MPLLNLAYFQMSLTPDTSCLFTQDIHSALKASVVVPVRNESEAIYRTLLALYNQFDADGFRMNQNSYEVLVLINNCTDNTLLVCESFKQNYPDFNLLIECIDFPTEQAHVGTARRLLMDAACRRLMAVRGEEGIIISTDGDSEVDPLWLYHTLQEVETGADVVGGRILSFDVPQGAKLHHLRNVTYRYLKARLESEIDPCRENPWPRHFQCYGPSLAVTCRMYEIAGRIPAIPYLEDEEFRKALKRVDAKIRNSPKVKVQTSSRLDGRVAFGFSVQLQRWGEMDSREEEQVESLMTLIYKYQLKHRLRACWQSQPKVLPGLMFTQSNLDEQALRNLWEKHIYFESFWESLEALLDDGRGEIISVQPISVAIFSLRNYFCERQKSLLKAVSEQAPSKIIAV